MRKQVDETPQRGVGQHQRVKIAAIVPTGAKGVLSQAAPNPVTDREGWLTEGKESYKLLLSARCYR